MKARRACWSMLLSLVLLSTAPAWTQDKPAELELRTVQGSVIDSSKKPVPSAVVYLLNVKTNAVRTYITDESIVPERRFSAPEIVVTEKKAVTGFPDMALASTSHVERLNGTTRLHMRRLTRLTYAFSKKRENFEAAVALHFAYYNFVKRHGTLRTTPAMAAGIERDFWTVGNLLEAVA